MPLPAACEAIQDELEALHAQLKSLQSHLIEGPHDPRPGKPDPLTLEDVRSVQAQIAQKSAQFDQCLRDHGLKPDMQSTFKGHSTLTIHDGQGEGTYPLKHVTIGLMFLKTHHRQFFVDDFPSITVHAPQGDVVITQSGGGNGTFHPDSGALTLPIKLDFDLPDPEGTSHLTLDLATSPDGSPVNHAGHLRAQDSSTFHGSLLDGNHATLVVDGTLSPNPDP